MSAYISVELQRRIRERFHDRCAYCQTVEALTATTFEFEHIQPLSLNGLTIFENVCLACPSCNRFKGTRQKARDPLTGEEVNLFHPHRQQWQEHFGWSEDQTKLIGRSPTGRATIEALKINRLSVVRLRRLWIKLGVHPSS
jgi:HNH endonuclease